MRIVHFGHACVLVETGAARLLCDPGTFSAGFETLRGLDAILITHSHFDHLDLDRLPPLLAENPQAELVVDEGSAAELANRGVRARTVRPGDALEIAGAAVNVVGGEHAVIYQDIPLPPNVGYLIDHGAFYHPGDSFFVPEQRVDVLGLPTAAPWLKISEAVDFLRAVGPRVAVPIHEALLANPQFFYGWFERLAPKGTEFRALPHGELVEVA